MFGDPASDNLLVDLSCISGNCNANDIPLLIFRNSMLFAKKWRQKQPPACKAIPISGTDECISKPSSMTGSASLLHIPPIFDHQMHSLPLLVNLTTQPYCNLAQLNAIFMNTTKCRPIPIPGQVDILVFEISIRLCLIICKLLLFTSGSHIPAQVMPRPIAREALAANEKVDWLHLRSTWPDPATLFVCKRKRFIFRGCLSNFPFHTTSTPLDCVGIQFLPITSVGRNKQCILSPWFFL